jgi:AcrR family transcriptional regulator
VAEDRRVRRTRRLLHQALLALVLERGYDRVTVQDVLDRADVARATFYTHFRDKDDLLLSGLDEIEQTLRQAMASYAQMREPHSEATIGQLEVLLEHAAEHRGLYAALLASRAGPLILREVRTRFTALATTHLKEMSAAHHATPVVPLPVMAEFAVGAILGLLSWWMERTTELGPEQLADMLERLMTPALAAGLALQDQQAAVDDQAARHSGTTTPAASESDGPQSSLNRASKR